MRCRTGDMEVVFRPVADLTQKHFESDLAFIRTWALFVLWDIQQCPSRWVVLQNGVACHPAYITDIARMIEDAVQFFLFLCDTHDEDMAVNRVDGIVDHFDQLSIVSFTVSALSPSHPVQNRSGCYDHS